MNFKKGLMVIYGLSLGAMALGSPSFAAPILSGSLPLAEGTSIKGISNLNANSGGTDVQVDWVVTLSGGTYTYEYQIENDTGSIIKNFSITAGNVLSVGETFSDLDVTSPHVFGGVDTENSGNGVDASPIIDSGFNGTQVSWTWGQSSPLDNGYESPILWFTSSVAPTFGNGTIQDSLVNWASTNVGSDKIPVPTPEPTTFLGGALGLAAVAWYTRRKRAQA
ncbi:MAG: PEP-CTERM sorting domain-containing protein [Nitrospira sp.]|nr:PEP-CTERM sorting domain-containing protein [Nitrospira sp.]